MNNPMREYIPSPLLTPSSHCNFIDVIPTVPEPSLILDEGVSLTKEKKTYTHNVEEHFAKKYSSSKNIGYPKHQPPSLRKIEQNKTRSVERNHVFYKHNTKENNIPDKIGCAYNVSKNMHPNFTPQFQNNLQRSRSHSTPYYLDKEPPILKEKCSLSAENHFERTPQSDKHPKSPINLQPFNNLLNTPSFNYSTAEENKTGDQRIWMKKFPSEAYQLFIQQNLQLLQLQDQVNNLLMSQKNEVNEKGCQKDGPDTVTVSTQTDLETPEKDFATIATNTDFCDDKKTENKIPKNTEDLNVTSQSETTPKLPQSPNSKQPSVNTSACVPSNDSTDKFAGWESESFNIEVQTFETQNNTSIASSLRAVDIPVLDSSLDQSQGTHEITNINSPVLGESASMCQISSEKSNSKEDKQFFGNLLNQVQLMLKEADIDIESKCSQENSPNTKPSRIVKNKLEDPNRIYTSTKRQLKKLGVNIDWNKKENLQRKSMEFLPQTTLNSQLLNLNVLTNRRSSYSQSDKLSDLSMHANAIALKYLSDEQKSSEKKKITFVVPEPPKTPPTQSTNTTIMMPGMSLISPCNMSLATRTYMKKYGLIEATSSSEDEEEEEIEEEKKQESSKNRNCSKNFRHPVNQNFNDKPNIVKEKPSNQRPPMTSKPEPDQNEMPNNLSQLKVNLGETLDMLLPFLEDLENKEQQTPSQQTSTESRKVYNPDTYDSKLTYDNENLSTYDSGVVENTDQILSPRVLNQFAQHNGRDTNNSRRNYFNGLKTTSPQRHNDEYFSDPQQSFFSDNPTKITHNSHSKIFSSLNKRNVEPRVGATEKKRIMPQDNYDQDFNIVQAFNKNRNNVLPQNSNFLHRNDSKNSA